jgi:hypothetical protein
MGVVSAQLIASGRGCIRLGVLSPNTLALSVCSSALGNLACCGRSAWLVAALAGVVAAIPRPSSRTLDVLAAISTE